MMQQWKRVAGIVVGALFFCSGCVNVRVRQHMPADIFPEIESGTRVAVSYIPEACTGDITALGNLWRDRIEKKLVVRGMVVKARKDIVSLIDDMETFGKEESDRSAWKKAGADVVVLGNYTIMKNTGTVPRIRVITKAYRVADFTLVSAREFVENLDSSWQRLAADVLGNIHQEKLAQVTSGDTGQRPWLKASLDRHPACYEAGRPVRINIQTDPGRYVYIFNLSADGNVSLLYPNQWLSNRPLPDGKLFFPPVGSGVRALVVFPLEGQDTSRESFKIISSDRKLDFSFLPVPENRIFAGANGKDIDRITRVLHSHKSYSQTTLTYYVGEACR